MAAESNPLFELIGYYKNLFSSSKTTDTKEGYYLDINRLRLQFNIRPSDSIETVVIVDNEVLLNDFSATSDFNTIRQRNQKSLAYLDADYVSADRRHYYNSHSLYRAYVKYTPSSSFSVIAGKQSIDWSRMRFYSPLDLFNPSSPLDLEKDEKIAVDAVNTEYFFGPASSLNIIAAPHESLEKARYGARLFKRAGDYDLYLVAGEFKKDEIIGAGFDGYISDAGFRGEFMCSRSDDEKDFARASLGADYSPNSKLYLLGEYFYNGRADDNRLSGFLASYSYAREMVTTKKHFCGMQASYELTPLLKFNGYTIYDFEGKSVFLNPELRYNIITDLDVSVGTQFFFGDETSEFGNYQDVFYAELKWFF